MKKDTLKRHPNHTSFFVADGILWESYSSIRGTRYRDIAVVEDTNLNLPYCTDQQAQEFYENYKLRTKEIQP